MIERLKLSNFKAHRSLPLEELQPITMVVGRNNVGKSTILHAAALPRYGPIENPNLPIGSQTQLVHEGANEGSVEISYSGQSSRFVVGFDKSGRYDAGWTSEDASKSGLVPTFFLSPTRAFRRSFQFAETQGDVGIMGENALNILHQLKANDDKRFDEVITWLRRMDFGISGIPLPTAAPGEGSAFPVTFGIRSNILFHGSGLRSILPLVIQGILAPPGSVLLVEEPEVHLHRASIDSLWGFFGDCAKRGVQVVATTHSVDLLISLNERLERGLVGSRATILHVMRDAGGQTSVRPRDPTVAKSILDYVREDLAGRPKDA